MYYAYRICIIPWNTNVRVYFCIQKVCIFATRVYFCSRLFFRSASTVKTVSFENRHAQKQTRLKNRHEIDTDRHEIDTKQTRTRKIDTNRHGKQTQTRIDTNRHEIDTKQTRKIDTENRHAENRHGIREIDTNQKIDTKLKSVHSEREG